MIDVFSLHCNMSHQDTTQVGLTEHDDMVSVLSADRSVNLSATPFCQGDLGANGLSRMPIVHSRRLTTVP
jgi:hypothetical protein